VNSFGYNDKYKEFATGYPKEGFGWVHLQLVSLHDVEYSFQVCEMIAFVAAFHDVIINIALYGLAYMLMEDRIHDTLICRTNILQAKGHYCVAVYSQWRPERCVIFIFRVHFYLIIP